MAQTLSDVPQSSTMQSRAVQRRAEQRGAAAMPPDLAHLLPVRSLADTDLSRAQSRSGRGELFLVPMPIAVDGAHGRARLHSRQAAVHRRQLIGQALSAPACADRCKSAQARRNMRRRLQRNRRRKCSRAPKTRLRHLVRSRDCVAPLFVTARGAAEQSRGCRRRSAKQQGASVSNVSQSRKARLQPLGPLGPLGAPAVSARQWYAWHAMASAEVRRSVL
jgi:hypothetical protein